MKKEELGQRHFCCLSRVVLVFSLLFLWSIPALADEVNLKVQVWGMNADGNTGDTWLDTGFTIGDVLANQDTEYTFNSGAFDLYDTATGTVLLGSFDHVEFKVKGDPRINLGFSVEAGAVDATFIIDSSVLTFGSLTDPNAIASAAVTLTEGNLDTATLTGKFGTNECYQAEYNSGSTFAELITGKTIGFLETSNWSDEKPIGGGYDTISGSVTSMQAHWKFELTAEDEASGTSTYVITPEPATICLIGLGGIALLRKRR